MLGEKQKQKKQKDDECQKLQQKLSQTEKSYLKQLEEKDMECQKLQEKLTKTEKCYFKQLEEAKREESDSSSPTSLLIRRSKQHRLQDPRRDRDQIALR